jgi:hypothetical protein
MIETELNLNSPELLELKKRIKQDICETQRLPDEQKEDVSNGLVIALLELEQLDRPFSSELILKLKGDAVK